MSNKTWTEVTVQLDLLSQRVTETLIVELRAMGLTELEMVDSILRQPARDHEAVVMAARQLIATLQVGAA